MATFSYKVISKENRIREGTLEAFGKRSAEKQLRKDGSTVLFVLKDATSSLMKREIPWKMFSFSMPEQIIFFRNFGAMISAGLPMTNSLVVLEEQAKGVIMKKVVRGLLSDINNGLKLSMAMRRHPRYFSAFVVETINVGEMTGQLSGTLDRIANDLEADYEISRKVMGAIIYPAIVVLVMIAVIITLVTIVLPKIAELFSESNVKLPLLTRILLYGSAFIRTHPMELIGAVIALIVAFFLVLKTKRGRLIIHGAYLKAPFFGTLIQEFNLARFFRALEALVSSGLSVVRSVEIAGKTLKNQIYNDALVSLHPALLHGTPLSEALKSHPKIFPTQTRRMIEVGENTGKLDEIFQRITSFYERAIHHKTQMMASLIEPILILIVGVVVGGLAISIFLPIYQLSSVL